MRISLDLFSYTDSRLFLRDALVALRDLNPKYSQRFVTQRLGLKSSGWLSDVQAGRRKFAEEPLRLWCEFLEMSARENAFYETLVYLTQSETQEERLRHFEVLLTFREVNAEVLGVERFEYFRNWYHIAIRELILLRPFRGDYVALAASLQPQIQPEEAKDAVQRLEHMGLIRRQGDGSYVATSVNVRKQTDFDRLHYWAHLRSTVELGMQAMEQVPKEERDMSTVAAALSEDSFLEICEDIKALRKKVLLLSEKESRERRLTAQTDPMRVYQFLFQGFPMSARENP
jgi:uncharacterized protein (TIGR02147 family)